MAARFVHRARPLIAIRPLTVLVSLTAAVAICVPAIASAAPSGHSARPAKHTEHTTSKPSVASVQKKLARLTMTNAELVEQFNQARLEVAHRTTAAHLAEQTAAKAAARYSQASSAFTQIVQAQYESGGFGGSGGALLTSNNTNSYLDAVSTMDLVSSHEAQVVTAVQQTRVAARQAYTHATALLAAATTEQRAVAAKKAQVTKQISSYKLQLAELTAAQMHAFDKTINASVTPADAAGLANAAPSAAAKTALAFAIKQIGKPYVFGSAGPNSYDCSGLTMMSWKAAGVSLPHSAAEQYNYGTHVSRSQLQPGDLIFVYQPIGHVTIYAGDGMMVSAPETGENVTLVPLANFTSDYAGATHLK